MSYDEIRRRREQDAGLKAIGSGIAWAGFWIGLGIALASGVTFAW